MAEYDPAIPGKEGLPVPADLVVCTDVLEHIEPELLSNVLDHLRSLANRFLLAAVSTRPAIKFLDDGRNAHLIVQPGGAWRPLLETRFTVLEWTNRIDEFVTVLGAKPGAPMLSGQSASELVSLGCVHCGHDFNETRGSLHRNSRLPCPLCGGPIVYRSPDLDLDFKHPENC